MLNLDDGKGFEPNGLTHAPVAGDGLGLSRARFAARVSMPPLAGIALEYLLGFGFGWTIFQALFMKRISDPYRQALASTFFSELLSMRTP